MLHSQLAVQSAGVKRLAVERDDIRRERDALASELAAERGKRISAEAIASERSETIKRMDAEVQRANESRNEAVLKRMDTVDSVNAMLLNRITPEINPDPAAAQAIFKKVSEILPSRDAKRKENIEHRVDSELLDITNKFRKSKQNPVTTIDNSQTG